MRRGVTACGPGSIPARAGEPTPGFVALPLTGVYPRACGGTGPKPPLRPPMPGLSPRVRGNLDAWEWRKGWKGSIPARAGEPKLPVGQPGLVRVYPRACGGTLRRVSSRRTCCGLSPRVRGNLRKAYQTGPRRRSIPARAGEPRTCQGPAPRSWVYPRACGGTEILLPMSTSCWGLSPRVRGNPGRLLA